MSLGNSVLLKVPRSWAEQYEKVAEQEGLTGRGAWAIKARQVLKEGLDVEMVTVHEGTEQEAATAEAV